MNQLAERTERLPMDSVGVTTSGTGSKIAPQTLAEVVKFAEVMCRADIALPKHLRGNAGACMAVAMQALEWQLSPFAVASKSYQVNGAIAYEAQLIAAVVNTRSGIKGRLKYAFEGEGNALTCTVTGTLDDEECVYTSPTIGSITTKNSPLWKSDPQQQLGYFAARSWARRHCPEVILGVYDRDEAEQFSGPDNARDVTPKPTVMERLRASQHSEPESAAETQTSTHTDDSQRDADRVLDGDIMDNEASDGEPLSSDDNGAPPVPSEPEGDPALPSGSIIPEDGFEPIPEKELPEIRKFAKIALDTANTNGMTSDILTKVTNRLINSELGSVQSATGRSAVNGIRKSAKAIQNGDADFDAAIEYFSDMLGCEPGDLIVERTDG